MNKNTWMFPFVCRPLQLELAMHRPNMSQKTKFKQSLNKLLSFLHFKKNFFLRSLKLERPIFHQALQLLTLIKISVRTFESFQHELLFDSFKRQNKKKNIKHEFSSYIDKATPKKMDTTKVILHHRTFLCTSKHKNSDCVVICTRQTLLLYLILSLFFNKHFAWIIIIT